MSLCASAPLHFLSDRVPPFPCLLPEAMGVTPFSFVLLSISKML